MLNLQNIRLIAVHSKLLCVPMLKRPTTVPRNFHEEFKNPFQTPAEPKTKQQPPPLAVSSKFQIFKDEDSPVILDMAEERLKLAQELNTDNQPTDIYAGLNLERMYTHP